MEVVTRSERELRVSVENREYRVSVVETPFREGVELSCEVEGEVVKVSDLGLGEHEALRLLEEEIIRRVT